MEWKFKRLFLPPPPFHAQNQSLTPICTANRTSILVSIESPHDSQIIGSKSSCSTFLLLHQFSSLLPFAFSSFVPARFGSRLSCFEKWNIYIIITSHKLVSRMEFQKESSLYTRRLIAMKFGKNENITYTSPSLPFQDHFTSICGSHRPNPHSATPRQPSCLVVYLSNFDPPPLRLLFLHSGPSTYLWSEIGMPISAHRSMLSTQPSPLLTPKFLCLPFLNHIIRTRSSITKAFHPTINRSSCNFIILLVFNLAI